MNVIDKERHARLMADKERVCMMAGLQPRFLMESMTKHCGDGEVDWVKNFHRYRAEGLSGLLLDGGPSPDTRCQAICGALVRNYIDARVIPVNTVLDMAEGVEAVVPTVVLIPNLYVQANGKSALSSWKVQSLYDVLLARSVQSKSTVAYVENMTGVTATYGTPFFDFLSGFKVVKG